MIHLIVERSYIDTDWVKKVKDIIEEKEGGNICFYYDGATILDVTPGDKVLFLINDDGSYEEYTKFRINTLDDSIYFKKWYINSSIDGSYKSDVKIYVISSWENDIDSIICHKVKHVNEMLKYISTNKNGVNLYGDDDKAIEDDIVEKHPFDPDGSDFVKTCNSKKKDSTKPLLACIKLTKN